ncbi:MAG: hypothetical protein C0624_06485 [Desulfuromonas sp.]|nr:MAG: hypothetical protein C0624_06485 [Desulfuromonas sp.]
MSAYGLTGKMNAGKLSSDLEWALCSGGLSLVYQPQVSLSDQQITGLEALARWNHPGQGEIPPGLFIEVAEKACLMPSFTRWVLSEACQQNVLWQRRGCPPLRVAVNVSPSNFSDPGFVDDVADILEQTGLEPCWLELELTECAIVKNREAAALSMQRLSAMGVSLALDDFGSGYASLSHFRHFPINRLKLDRTFVRDLPGACGRKEQLLVEAIMLFARHMGLDTVAEGVENESQRKLLREIGCLVGQGFLLGRPMTVDELDTVYQPSTFDTSCWGRGVPTTLLV